MKTTRDRPDEGRQEAMRRTGAKSERDAVVRAGEELERRRRLAHELGSFDGFLTREEPSALRRMR